MAEEEREAVRCLCVRCVCWIDVGRGYNRVEEAIPRYLPTYIIRPNDQEEGERVCAYRVTHLPVVGRLLQRGPKRALHLLVRLGAQGCRKRIH